MRPEYIPVVIAWIAMAIWTTIAIFMNRKHHPKALFQLFMVEIWERFSYYGMRAVLVLYMISAVTDANPGFGLSKPEAYSLFAGFAGLVYLTPLVGGRLADQVLGAKNAIILGCTTMAAGQFMLSMSRGSKFMLIAGLATIVVGNGFFKPNISAMIGKLYPAGDVRRDSAFSIFYMGINIGAFLSPLTCGAIGVVEGRTVAFFVAGAFMLLGLVIFLWTAKSGTLGTLADAPVIPAKSTGFRVTPPMVYVGTVLSLPLVAGLMSMSQIMDGLLGFLVVGMIAYILFLSSKEEKVQRQRFWVICLLFFFTSTFWCFFELAASALTVFAEQNVQKQFLGMTLTAESFQSFNAIFVVTLAMPFAAMWTYLAKRGKEPSTGLKFGVGLLLLGGGFYLLKAGVPFAVAGMMPAIFLAGMYFLHTLGELAISPVGLSLVTKMAPAKMSAFLMGFWMLATSVGSKIGGYIASAASAAPNATVEETLHQSMSVFIKVGSFAVAAGVLLIVITPIVTRWMHMGVTATPTPTPELDETQEAEARS